ncbi:hypothetical protein KVR01_001051 [Diaporthe batatas]|uniref:uncharacterized protein n=1 Tax=Diaporthe batatas TaxID=748121 RepID=UPI001D03C3C9|nr:uncharacterized protein KVR01_001051 [Diaporthe batatas]KAG8170306.1 hypothetical protein KVR01_001051 [Diaporthe batatas]
MYDAMEVDEDIRTGADSNMVSPRLPAIAEKSQRVQAGNTKRRKRSRRRSATVARRKQSGSRLRAKRANKGDWSQIHKVSSSLIRVDALAFFADNCEMALASWISILRKTALPDNITSSDPRVVTAFQELDSIIFGRESTRMLKRLAYMQLLRVFESLEQIIDLDHRDGRVEFRSGYGASSLAIDIYASAQGRPTTKRKLGERTRYARRLRDLTVQPPFSLLIYSDVAETVADRSSGFNVPTLKFLASHIAQTSPPGLAIVCRELAKIAESAVQPGQSCDTRSVAAQTVAVHREPLVAVYGGPFVAVRRDLSSLLLAVRRGPFVAVRRDCTVGHLYNPPPSLGSRSPLVASINEALQLLRMVSNASLICVKRVSFPQSRMFRTCLQKFLKSSGLDNRKASTRWSNPEVAASTSGSFELNGEERKPKALYCRFRKPCISRI